MEGIQPLTSSQLISLTLPSIQPSNQALSNIITIFAHSHHLWHLPRSRNWRRPFASAYWFRASIQFLFFTSAYSATSYACGSVAAPSRFKISGLYATSNEAFHLHSTASG